MSVTRKQLKSIVKECLVEILSEGIGSSTSELVNEASTNKVIPTSARLSTTTPRGGQQNAAQTKLRTFEQSPAIKEAIRRESGGNNIMAAILADTAEKTLPNMLENDRKKALAPMGKIENIVAMKEASGNMEQIMELIRLKPDGF